MKKFVQTHTISKFISQFETMKDRQRNQRETHTAPPPAGPIALNIDIIVIAMPLAAPL